VSRASEILYYPNFFRSAWFAHVHSDSARCSIRSASRAVFEFSVFLLGRALWGLLVSDPPFAKHFLRTAATILKRAPSKPQTIPSNIIHIHNGLLQFGPTPPPTHQQVSSSDVIWPVQEDLGLRNADLCCRESHITVYHLFTTDGHSLVSTSYAGSSRLFLWLPVPLSCSKDPPLAMASSRQASMEIVKSIPRTLVLMAPIKLGVPLVFSPTFVWCFHSSASAWSFSF